MVSVKKAIGVAAGEDHTLVLTALSYPPLPAAYDTQGERERGVKGEKGVYYTKEGIEGRERERKEGMSVAGTQPVLEVATLASSKGSDSSDDEEEEEEDSEEMVNHTMVPPPPPTPTPIPTSTPPSLFLLAQQQLAKAVTPKNAIPLYLQATRYSAHTLSSFLSVFIERNLDYFVVSSSSRYTLYTLYTRYT